MAKRASKGKPKATAAAERTYAALDDDAIARIEGETEADEAGAAEISAAAQPSMAEIFGPGGLLEKCHGGYEYRRSQLEMAEIVEAALQEKKHALVEAGTGTGKTLGYLIPAIRSGRRIVVSTATKSLQEQLYSKDVPFLQRHFAPELKVAVMKGRNNFVCRAKVHHLAEESHAFLRGMDELDWFTQIRDWEKLTETGDRAELNFLPDDNELWPRIDARRETCTGSKCAEFNQCFLTKMHQRAREADIIIVNHHLFFADLALKQDDFGSILPEYSAVVFDEAHEIEDVASDYFGRRISNYRFEELARDTENVLRLAHLSSPPLLKRCAQLKERSRTFFDAFPARDGRFAFDANERAGFLERHREAYDDLTQAVKRLETDLSALPGKPDEVVNLARRAFELRGELVFLLEKNEKNNVYWYERRNKGVFVTATPIDVSAILREKLFAEFDTAVLTSATLAVAGRFDYVKQRLGIDSARERVLEHEFDFGTQAVLYIPKELPDVREPGFVLAASEEIARMLEITRGRAFCLFTSYNQMKEIHERVRKMVRFPLYLQGTSPRSALLDRFKNTPGSVLFATSSFWQGVDVPGEQLSCVIIDRLPFAVPSDPIVAARVKALTDDGRNAFAEYQVPEAVLALKQGFGRLIRSRSDRGVLSILDNRIQRKQYGRIFIESLPEYKITHDIAEVKRFMQHL